MISLSGKRRETDNQKRKAMLNRLISRVLPYIPPKLVWQFSKDYIAGETVDDVVAAALKLNDQNIITTIDVLGEFITKLEEAVNNTHEYLEVIEAAETAQIKGNYSLKPTSFGLLIDKDAAYRHIRQIVTKAAEHNNFVRLDMEDSPCTDLEIELYGKLKEEFPHSVGLVLQAYLRRTYQDLQNLTEIHSQESPVNLRLCKGIYVEAETIAYKDYKEINHHFLNDIEFMFQHGMYTAIATHDLPIVEGSYELIEKYQVDKNSYEFQMLYGVTPSLRKSIMDQGHRMRVYVPFGEQWFGYCTRRLKENPNMLSMLIKALVKKG